MIEPTDIFRSERGIWHAQVQRDGKLYWFSLRTRDEAAARRRWAKYIETVKSAHPDTPAQEVRQEK